MTLFKLNFVCDICISMNRRGGVVLVLVRECSLNVKTPSFQFSRKRNEKMPQFVLILSKQTLHFLVCCSNVKMATLLQTRGLYR